MAHPTMHRQANAAHMKGKVQHTQASQGNRFTFCHSEGSAAELATLGLSPCARRARCLSAHRPPSARLLAPGGEGRASGPRSPHLLARERHLLDDHKVAASPPSALPTAPLASSRWLPLAAALLHPGHQRERSRAGQRTLSHPRSVARALAGRLDLLGSRMDAHGFLCRCTV